MNVHKPFSFFSFFLSLEKGKRIGVFFLYSWYSMLFPHFFSPFASNKGSPETFVSRKYTNIGDIRLTSYHPFKDYTRNMPIPNQTSISPQQFGCLLYFQIPSRMNLPWLSLFNVNINFCVSATISTTIPKTHIITPIIYMGLFLNSQPSQLPSLKRQTKTGLPVIVTHSPCKIQDIKNLIFSSFIVTNLLSCPNLIIRQNKKPPRRIVQTKRRSDATTCLSVILLQDDKQKIVDRMNVMLPVKSQNFYVLKILAGTNAMICIKCIPRASKQN